MTFVNDEYLQPSELCDFDRHPEIKTKALGLTSGCGTEEEKYLRIYSYVKEMPYILEDWNVTASETLAKKKGMCSSKSNLMVALLRALGIRSRYRVYRIKAEVKLWRSIIEDRELRELMGCPPEVQDHVDCEVWLDGWTPCDPARDTPLERGLAAMGMTLERETVPDEGTGATYSHLARFDEWALERQRRRTIRDRRQDTFEKANRVFDRIRSLGATEGSLQVG
jgi:hypothetical protein